MPIHATGLGRTHIGRVRKGNEDAFLVDDTLGLYAVSDGMGGHAAGDLASRLAVEAVASYIGERHKVRTEVMAGERPRGDLLPLVAGAVNEACRVVFERAQSDPQCVNMGCTLTLVLMAGERAAMAHVGDSRMYLLRGAGMSLLSSDHNLASELARGGFLDEDEVEGHPQANVLTRAVGLTPAVQVDSLIIDVAPGDRLMLCSDGYSKYLQKSSLLEIASGDAGAAADRLVQEANEAGGKDNITVVLVDVTSDAPLPDRLSVIEDRYAALKSVFLFEELDMQLLARVMDACTIHQHDADAVVIEQGEQTQELLIVVSGSYELRHDDGTRVATLGPGEHVGADTLFHARPVRAQVAARGPSKMLRLQGEHLKRLFRARPWLGVGLLERLGRQLSDDLERSYAQRMGNSAPPSGTVEPIPASERL